MNNKVNKYYNFNEIKEKYTKKPNTYSKSILFKLNIFNKMQKEYFERTPESDSLYRRRNRLIILFFSGLFYYKTSAQIFNRIEIEIFSGGSFFRKMLIPVGKTCYFIGCIFLSQLVMKYIYYLNKIFKSYQFALEGVLKYNILENNYVYKGDLEETDKFDIMDSENIKKNQ
jgi:hypothetical protein